jgi:hypothetical protein
LPQKKALCKYLTYRALFIKTVAVWTGLEPATSAVTGRHSNQLNYQTVYRSPEGQRHFPFWCCKGKEIKTDFTSLPEKKFIKLGIRYVTEGLFTHWGSHLRSGFALVQHFIAQGLGAFHYFGAFIGSCPVVGSLAGGSGFGLGAGGLKGDGGSRLGSGGAKQGAAGQEEGGGSHGAKRMCRRYAGCGRGQ